MKNLEVRTTNTKSRKDKYTKNINNTIIFLRHPEDKIIVKNKEVVEIEIYDNGKLIFSGDKYEFYSKLKRQHFKF